MIRTKNISIIREVGCAAAEGTTLLLKRTFCTQMNQSGVRVSVLFINALCDVAGEIKPVRLEVVVENIYLTLNLESLCRCCGCSGNHGAINLRDCLRV